MNLLATGLVVTLAQVVALTPLVDVDASYPAWSPDGRRIAFQSAADGSPAQIYVVELESRRLTRLTHDAAENVQPAWSPDGSELVFVSSRDGNPEIYRMKADGSSPVRLTQYPKRDLHPRFSADGSRILFNREQGEGRSSTALIYAMSRDGADEHPLSDNPFPFTYPSQSPVGTTLLFVHWTPPAAGERQPNTDVALLEPGGEEPQRLTSGPGFDGYPSFSPQGDWIAFVSDRTGRRQVYLMRPDGSSLTALTEGVGMDFSAPSWAPDGSRLVVAGGDGTTRRLYLIRRSAP